MRRWWLAGLALAVLLGGAGGVLVLGGRTTSVSGLPPSGRPSPDPSRTPLLAAPGGGAVPSTAGLRRALDTVLHDPGLGTRVAVSVLDAASGAALLEIGAGQPVPPASTAKIATALAVLTVLPADRRFTTTVVQGAPGDVVLVGAGDPTLAGRSAPPGFPGRARLADLAAQLKGVAVRRVVVDDRLFAGPRTGPGWKPGYVTHGDVSPVSALAVDGGRLSGDKGAPRSQDSAVDAGRQLAALLRVTTVVRGAAPVGATVLAHADSPTVGELVESMLTSSDNNLAEALGRQVALAGKLPPTFDGESAAIEAAVVPLLARAGLGGRPLALRDASGLSPLDRLRPAALSRLLALADRDARFAPLLSGLPVAGFDGTLADRYRKGRTAAAAGAVRAKTGTLDGVSALAGLVRTRGGRLLAFDLTADRVPAGGTLQAQFALDRVATVLASCGCP